MTSPIQNQSAGGKSKKPQSIETQIFVGLFKGLWWIIALPFRMIFKRRPKNAVSSEQQADANYIRMEWAKIQELISIGGESNGVQAIIRADKLLDYCLIKKGVQGQTMGDRLKNSQQLFYGPESYQQAWQGHKLRNQVAHEANFEFMHFQAKSAVDSFYDALVGLGML